MHELALEEFCDCLEYDLLYDREEINEAIKESNFGQLKRLHGLINRRQCSILKIIGDNYTSEEVPDRLLDIYLKAFALEHVIEKLIQSSSTS